MGSTRTRINGLESDGYNVLMNAVRSDDIVYDPWGTSMSWLFALAEVTWVAFGVNLPGFQPSPLLRDRSGLEEDSNASDVLDQLDTGFITESDIRRAFDVLSRFDEWCRQAGRDY